MEEVEKRVKRLYEAITKLSVVIAYRSDESLENPIAYVVGWSYLDDLLQHWQKFGTEELINYRTILLKEYRYMIDRYYYF